jgi:hypothetical protein
MFQTVFPSIIRSSKLHIQRQAFVRPILPPAQQYRSDKCLTLYVQFWAPDDGRKNRLKHVERCTEINRLWNVASCWLHSANLIRKVWREKNQQHATVKWNTNLMQHCAGFISAESLYIFRAQAPIINCRNETRTVLRDVSSFYSHTAHVCPILTQVSIRNLLIMLSVREFRENLRQ